MCFLDLVNQYLFLHTFASNWQQSFLNDSAEGRRMTVEIISWSISTKVWDQAWIEHTTPWSAVRLISVARHVTDCMYECQVYPGVFRWNCLSLISNGECQCPSEWLSCFLGHFFFGGGGGGGRGGINFSKSALPGVMLKNERGQYRNMDR